MDFSSTTLIPLVVGQSHRWAFSGIGIPLVMGILLNPAEAEGVRGFIKDSCASLCRGIKMPSQAVFPLHM